MAMKAAFADRNPHMADPNFQAVPVDWMISKERAHYWRDQIDSGAEFSAAFDINDTPSTTHVSVVDNAGQLCRPYPLSRLRFRCHHAGHGFHVQQLDDQLLPPAWTP